MCRLSVENLKYSINQKKKISLDRLIFALGIRHIGLENAKLLSKYFESFSEFKNLSKTKNYEDLLNIDGIGETQIKSIKNFFSNKANLEVLLELRKILKINNVASKMIMLLVIENINIITDVYPLNVVKKNL